MPFDGNDNTLVSIPLITPYHSHPRAPASGRCAAMALEHAYVYARAHARMVGIQTYRVTQLTSLANNFSVNSATVVPVGRWRADLPSFATVLVAYFSFGLVGATEATVTHQLDITDGVDTDTGDAIITTVKADKDAALNVGGYTSYDYGGAINAVASVTRNLVAGSVTNVTVTAYACAVDPEGNAVGYRPHLVHCFYEVIG